MSFWEIYLFAVLGIMLSLVLPILRRFLPALPQAAEGGWWRQLWDIAQPYIVTGLFSLAVGLVIVAQTGEALQDWRAALLAGYAWDSTLQKLSAR